MIRLANKIIEIESPEENDGRRDYALFELQSLTQFFVELLETGQSQVVG